MPASAAGAVEPFMRTTAAFLANTAVQPIQYWMRSELKRILQPFLTKSAQKILLREHIFAPLYFSE
jgi:hypothetical protein